jgi:hypothetical protein
MSANPYKWQIACTFSRGIPVPPTYLMQLVYELLHVAPGMHLCVNEHDFMPYSCYLAFHSEEEAREAAASMPAILDKLVISPTSMTWKAPVKRCMLHSADDPDENCEVHCEDCGIYMGREITIRR